MISGMKLLGKLLLWRKSEPFQEVHSMNSRALNEYLLGN
jgi:hypothetical protein